MKYLGIGARLGVSLHARRLLGAGALQVPPVVLAVRARCVQGVRVLQGDGARRPGACSAATRGAAAAWTTRTTRGCSRRDRRLDPHAARGPAPQHPRRAALDRPAVGVGDRRADDHRADPARAADGQADPLDAEHAGARAADEGDPAEVQGRPPEAQRRADEVLQGEQHQPGVVVPAARRAVPDLHRPLLTLARRSRRIRPSAGTSRGCTSCRASPRRRTRTGRATCCSSSTSRASSRRRTSCPGRCSSRSGS